MKDTFTEGRIRIRPFRPEDVPALFAAARESLNELQVWLPWCHPGYAIEETWEWVGLRELEWQRDVHYAFVVEDRESGRFLGGVGLNFIVRPHQMANLGYWVRTSEAGQGVASTAARLAAHFGLREAGFSRLEIMAALGNPASQRVAEKAGARREGILRKRLCIHGKTHDATMNSLVLEDLPPLAG